MAHREMACRVLIERKREREGGEERRGKEKGRGEREGKYKGSFGFVLVYCLIPVFFPL